MNAIRKVKNYITVLAKGIRFINSNIITVLNGQDNNYAILQELHRLEKGLSIRNPREGWGYDKANHLLDLLIQEEKKQASNVTSLRIGKAVLAEYLKHKEETEPNESKLSIIKDRIAKAGLSSLVDQQWGGTIVLKKEDMFWNMASIENLFYTRHSIRDFDDSPIDDNKLKKAIQLALRAPSACNRQASQIYVMDGKDREKCGAGNEFHADKYLIVTGNMKAFSLFELNDWIVSSSIFCGYLNLALHSVGIGSCCIRKDIVFQSEYNDAVKKLCGIPKDEQIIMEMAIGNYKDVQKVPVSKRMQPQDILHYTHD